MSEEANKLFCGRCNKLLQNVSCIACDGKGYFREKLILKKECNLCQGSGQVRQCPDENQHRLDRIRGFSRTNLPSPNLFSPSTPKQPIYPPAQPPWNPNNPNSPFNPMHPRSPLRPNSPLNPHNPLNPPRRLPGDDTTDAPPPEKKPRK